MPIEGRLPMTGAELPLPIPRQLRDSNAGSDEPDPGIPTSLGGWVAALTLWPVIDQAFHELAARCYGDGLATEWKAFALLVIRLGVAEPGPEPDTYVFDRHWGPALERELEELGGSDPVRARLVDAWLADPNRRLLTPVSVWARDLGRWDVFERIWLLLGEQTSGLSEETLKILRDLPLEARHARPILTWASGAAASLLSTVPRQETEAVWQRLLLDSAMLHADWSIREDTDEAVGAGTFRMIGERRLPASRAGQSLAAAWRTKEDIDAFIDARSRAGRGPGRTPQAIFRTFSARLALFRFDTLGAMNEAGWATILADWEPVAVVAKGVQAIAMSLSTEDGPAHHSDPPLAGVDDDLGARGLRGIGQLYEILADGNEAVRRLDRDELDRCLALVSADDAALAGVWSMRVSLAGWREALWGDVERGLAAMSADVQRLSLIGREQDEPFGASLLSRTRVMLLTKAGAFGAATQVAETMPERFRLLSQARIHLWSGQYKRAVREADAGSYQPGLDTAERSRLTLVRMAAAAMEGAGSSVRSEAVQELERMLRTETFVHVALLPKAARDLLLELCLPGLDPSNDRLRLLVDRLATLNDSGGSGARALHLTERETVLLPLLATDQSVPDIARQLHVSVNTVRKQVVTLREKFEADSRADLVRKARTYGAI
jgi:DNA-binding CsgD family transcriptional regulator